MWYRMQSRKIPAVELPTLAMLLACYGLLAIATTIVPPVSNLLAFALATIAIALHSSLQHEALHGHPTRHSGLNEALVFPAIGLLIPYRRFRDLHLAHHVDTRLTDPYDDPESNFFCPDDWARMPRWVQLIYRLNNTLAGRILLGPALSMICMVKSDLQAVRRGEPGVAQAWALHAIGLVPVIWWLATIATMPVWIYAAAAYFGFGLLKIRTYLEHRAHESPAGRTVIIEDRGFFAWLFLNNNYHIVHHSHPGAPWYRMQAYYYADPLKYQALNDAYVYRNYREIFARHLFRAKDPLVHPMLDQG
ncbi:MAG: fatty acid desaturase [Rhodobacteraceae bacterium]|nr:fatty acid desaturase [Paracoccaceae bacterium]